MLAVSDVDIEVHERKRAADTPGRLDELEDLRSENARLRLRMAKTRAGYEALKRDHAGVHRRLIQLELENEELRRVVTVRSEQADRRAYVQKMLSCPASMNP
jgi:hypothetical protein